MTDPPGLFRASKAALCFAGDGPRDGAIVFMQFGVIDRRYLYG